MTKKARSAKGMMVDFDQIKIKQQLTDKPTPIEVQQREDQVDQRLKRRIRRLAEQTALAGKVEAVDIQDQAVVPVVDELMEEDSIKRKQKTKKHTNSDESE